MARVYLFIHSASPFGFRVLVLARSKTLVEMESGVNRALLFFGFQENDDFAADTTNNIEDSHSEEASEDHQAPARADEAVSIRAGLTWPFSPRSCT